MKLYRVSYETYSFGNGSLFVATREKAKQARTVLLSAFEKGCFICLSASISEVEVKTDKKGLMNLLNSVATPSGAEFLIEKVKNPPKIQVPKSSVVSFIPDEIKEVCRLIVERQENINETKTKNEANK